MFHRQHFRYLYFLTLSLNVRDLAYDLAEPNRDILFLLKFEYLSHQDRRVSVDNDLAYWPSLFGKMNAEFEQKLTHCSEAERVDTILWFFVAYQPGVGFIIQQDT